MYFNGKIRSESFNRLKSFLVNPGYFSVFVGGPRGSGKTFAIEHAYQQLKNETKKGDQVSLKSMRIIGPTDIDDSVESIQQIFTDTENGILVLKDIADFSEAQQNILFRAMQTSDGTLGLKKKVFIRLVFVSSYPVEDLRSGATNLKPLLWDRISQLIAVFPSFSEEPDSISIDFRNTWEKMKFGSIAKYKGLHYSPKIASWDRFLEKYATEFRGGFRDLDKLCILYFNYRIYIYKETRKISEEYEKRIVQYIRDDFFGKIQTKEKSIDELAEFRFNQNDSMKVMEAKFRYQVRRWAERLYGGIGKAEDALGLGSGTMKNYTQTKIAEAQKKSEIKGTVRGKRASR